MLYGTIIDSETLASLRGVHAYSNLSNGTFSDIDGNFHLVISHYDTLYFSILGYDSLAIVVNDSLTIQSIIVSMKSGATMLDSVSIFDFYQADTDLTKQPRVVYRVSGIKYPENPKGKNYRLGVGGAIFSPATAIYRLTSKSYKEEKRHHIELYQNEAYRIKYNQAKKILFDALEVLGESLDEYYLVDFIHFLGLTIESTAKLTAYDMAKILPGEVDRYLEHLNEILKGE